jgi:hypothetical protein
MRLPEALLLAALLPMAAAPAAALDLPVVNPALEPIESAAYRADRIELRLAPEASRLAAIAVASQRAAEPARLQRPALGIDRKRAPTALCRSLVYSHVARKFSAEALSLA